MSVLRVLTRACHITFQGMPSLKEWTSLRGRDHSLVSHKNSMGPRLECLESLFSWQEVCATLENVRAIVSLFPCGPRWEQKMCRTWWGH